MLALHHYCGQIFSQEQGHPGKKQQPVHDTDHWKEEGPTCQIQLWEDQITPLP